MWQLIATALLASAKLPALLNTLSNFGVHVPEVWGARVNFAITCCSATALLMARLTTQCKTEINDKGTVIKTTDPQKLPFTAIHESKNLK